MATTATTAIDRDEAVPADLQAWQSRLEAYASGESKPHPEVWRNSREASLKALRQGDLHLSARMDLGHDPRIEGGRRVRKVYDG